MTRPLPMADYNSLVGMQIDKPMYQSPMVQNMPTAGPMPPPPQLRQRPMRSFEEVCQIIDEMEQAGKLTSERQRLFNQQLAQAGYPSSSRCPHNMIGPFQSETVQYLLLFLLAYVVIKKL